MIVCLNQSACFLEETLNSVKYAEKAMKIRPPPVEAKVPLARDADDHLLRKRIWELERELGLMRNKEVEMNQPLITTPICDHDGSATNIYDESVLRQQVSQNFLADGAQPPHDGVRLDQKQDSISKKSRVQPEGSDDRLDIRHLLRETPSLDHIVLEAKLEEPKLKNFDVWAPQWLSDILQSAFEVGHKHGRLETGLDYLDQVLATGERAISECQGQIDREMNQDKVVELYRSLKNVADKVEQDLNRRTELIQEIKILKSQISDLTTLGVTELTDYLEEQFAQLKSQSSVVNTTLKHALVEREHQIIELSKAFRHMFSQPKNSLIEASNIAANGLKNYPKKQPTLREAEIDVRSKPDFRDPNQPHRVTEVIKNLTQALRPTAEGSLEQEALYTAHGGFGSNSLGSNSDVCGHQSPASTPRSTNLEPGRMSPNRLDSTQRKNPPSHGGPEGSTEKKRLLRQSKSSAKLRDSSIILNHSASGFATRDDLHSNTLKIEELRNLPQPVARKIAPMFVNPRPEVAPPAPIQSYISRHTSVASGPRRFSNNRNIALEQSSTNPMSLVSGGGFTDIHS